MCWQRRPRRVSSDGRFCHGIVTIRSGKIAQHNVLYVRDGLIGQQLDRTTVGARSSASGTYRSNGLPGLSRDRRTDPPATPARSPQFANRRPRTVVMIRLPAAAAARYGGRRPVAHRPVLRRLRHELRVEARIRRIKGVHRPIDRSPQVVRLTVDERLPYAAAAGDVDLVARPARDPALQRGVPEDLFHVSAASAVVVDAGPVPGEGAAADLRAGPREHRHRTRAVLRVILATGQQADVVHADSAFPMPHDKTTRSRRSQKCRLRLSSMHVASKTGEAPRGGHTLSGRRVYAARRNTVKSRSGRM